MAYEALRELIPEDFSSFTTVFHKLACLSLDCVPRTEHDLELASSKNY